jgi:hypothetical protein
MIELIKERKSYIDIHRLTTVEWQTQTLVNFMSFLAQSPEAMKAINDHANKLSIFKGEESKDSPVNGSAPEPRKGSAEKLAMLFGRRGVRPGG